MLALSIDFDDVCLKIPTLKIIMLAALEVPPKNFRGLSQKNFNVLRSRRATEI